MTELTDEFKAYHEASHAIVAKYFDNYLVLQSITISQQNLQNKDSHPLDGGELHIIVFNKKDDCIQGLFCSFLASLIGQNIYLESAAAIKSQKSKIINDPNILDLRGTSGDIELYKSTFKSLVEGEYDTQAEIYQRNQCLEFLIDFLCLDKIWNFVHQLANALINSLNKSLSNSELEDIFKTSGYHDYLIQNKQLLGLKYK